MNVVKPLEVTVVSVTFIRPQGLVGTRAAINAVMSDGTKREPLLQYFDDEIDFSEAELIGKTERQISALFFEKDRAYLQS